MTNQTSRSIPVSLLRVLAVLGAIALLAFLVLPHFCQASEDAIILYQYSLNLAKTGIISYVPHGPRAEGATDFLWMVYLAAGRFLGIPSYGLAIVTDALCVLLLAATCIKAAGRRLRITNVLAVTFFFLLAPQTFSAEAGFSVFAFALFLGLLAASAYFEAYGFAVLCGLLLCLVRPDGVVFAIPVLAIYLFRGQGFKSNWWKALLGFVLPGLMYFIWRWHYFGHLLPLPFYVKSDTQRLFHILVLQSAISLAAPLLAAVLLLWIALRRELFAPRNRTLAVTLLVPSSLFYLEMRLDQNYANRFFFYPLVVAAILLAANYDVYRERTRRVFWASIAVWVVLLAYFWINWAVIYTLEYPQPREVAVARELSQLPGRGTMIVSESGAIPFYSQWTAYDPWGLNTPAFALHLIQPEDVRALSPDLVVLHQATAPAPCVVDTKNPPPHAQRSWDNMTQNVIGGIDPTQYTQWLLPQYNNYYRSHPRRWNGQRRYGLVDYQCWFVRNASPQSAAVTAILTHHGAISTAEYRSGRIAPPE